MQLDLMWQFAITEIVPGALIDTKINDISKLLCFPTVMPTTGVLCGLGTT